MNRFYENHSMKTIIIGAGISGLATACALLEKKPDLDLLVLEASDCAGGKVWSDKSVEGFLCEAGVNAFLDSKPKTLELASRLGLIPVSSYEASRNRFIYSDKRLVPLPGSPPAFLTSSLLSIPGRLRVMLETLIPRGTVTDESLAAFAIRRLGKEAYDKLIDPMASGVYAGDAARLSLKSCFPRINEIETKYRSLIIGLITLQAKALREHKRDMPNAGPAGKLTSFTDGMSVLTNAIADKLGSRLRLAMPVLSLSRNHEYYTVDLADGSQEEAETIILAAPAFAQATILAEVAPDIADHLRGIPYPSLSVCCLGYKRDRIRHDLNGFGFLVPSRENRQVLGTLWDASIFPNRAPEGYVLLRSMIGGARNARQALLSDDKLVDVVRKELAIIMGIDATPDFVRVYRHERSIPQYIVGHAQRLKLIDGLLTQHPGLILTGNAYKGVALNDCVINAYQIAESLIPD